MECDLILNLTQREYNETGLPCNSLSARCTGCLVKTATVRMNDMPCDTRMGQDFLYNRLTGMPRFIVASAYSLSLLLRRSARQFCHGG